MFFSNSLKKPKVSDCLYCCAGMAAAGFLLSEETFKCSVCLDIFTKPVSTPCGHNFCNDCIQKYWDATAISRCPYCKTMFPKRLELRVNTVLNELMEHFKALAQAQGSDADPQKNPEEQLCKAHGKLRELYYRTNREFVCTECFRSNHKGRFMGSLEEEFESVAPKMGAAVAGLEKMIKQHFHRIDELEMLVENFAVP